MKKLLSMLLSICLVTTLTLPALAADAGLDDRLANITLLVKQTLSIGDEFTEFSGQLTEGDPVNCWDLNWKSDHANIDVTVTESGKIVNYYLHYNENTYVSPSGELKKFPKLSRAKAEKIAHTFLAQVLDTRIESVDLEEGINLITRYNSGDYNFYGTLKLRKLDTPVYVNVTVNSAKQTVTSFYRGDSGMDYKDLPSSAKISKDMAASKLFETVNMRLNYVVSDQDENQAILRYTPESKADYVVDALNGKLIELQQYFFAREATANAVADSSAKSDGGLTDVELQAVTDLKGALSSSELEAAARDISELNITNSFDLNRINYYKEKNESTADIFANLSFTKERGTSYAHKNVSLNAKTGEFIACSSYAFSDKTPKLKYNQDRSEEIARSFAQKYNPDNLNQTVLSEAEPENNDRYQTFTFVRQVNDILFPANYIVVTVDRTDGSIGDYNVSWDDDMVFADPTGIKTAEEAKDIFTTAAGIGLCYENVRSNDENRDYLKLVFNYVDKNIWGVDAATGNLLKFDSNQDDPLTYSDITNHYAQNQITKLSQYGIGYVGGTFAPNQTLTQKDALTLITAASGFSLDQTAEDFEENLYSAAYSIGILNQVNRNPSASVTRAQLTKLLVDAAGYSEVAQLKNIYFTGFKDETSIPTELFGYVAIAKGLNIINGDTRGYFHPNNTATRAQLAIMLYNIMSR